MTARRLPALRDIRDDLRDRRLADEIEYLPPGHAPVPAVIDRTPTRHDPHAQAVVDALTRNATQARRDTLTTNDRLDRLLPDQRAYHHTTRLGGFHPAIVDWLHTNGVPISPPGTVMLLKGVGMDYRSAHHALYLPAHMVIDPDWGHRDGAGIYLCGSRRNVEFFVHGSYRLMLVEVAVSALGMYAHDRRKIVAREVYVHREIPR